MSETEADSFISRSRRRFVQSFSLIPVAARWVQATASRVRVTRVSPPPSRNPTSPDSSQLTNGLSS
jgi:hypothetical protein